MREAAQRLELPLVQGPRRPIGDGERADRRAFVDLERNAGVEADERIARDERVVGEARVEVRVRNDERRVPHDAVAAEREIPGRPRLRDADARLEPLAVGVDERDERDLGPAQIGGELRHVVEGLLGGRVHDVARPQQREPLLLVRWNGRLQHDGV